MGKIGPYTIPFFIWPTYSPIIILNGASANPNPKELLIPNPTVLHLLNLALPLLLNPVRGNGNANDSRGSGSIGDGSRSIGVDQICPLEVVVMPVIVVVGME